MHEDSDALLARRLQEEELSSFAFQSQGQHRINIAPETDDVQAAVRDQLARTGLTSMRVFGAYVLHAILESLLILIVLSIGWGQTCDRPLNWWLLGYVLRHTIRIPARAIILAKVRRSMYSERGISITRERKILNLIELYAFIMWIVAQSVSAMRP